MRSYFVTIDIKRKFVLRIFSFEVKKISLNLCTIISYVAVWRKSYFVSLKYSVTCVVRHNVNGVEITKAFGRLECSPKKYNAFQKIIHEIYLFFVLF